MQAPNKNKSRAVILSDSHLKGYTNRINNYLNDKFRAFGWIKPGTLAKEILDRLTVDLVNLKKRDVIVISAGANNVYRNNPNEALMKIIKFIQNNGNTNIMILGISHRHDLVEYSCVNRAIRVFNHKLKKLANSFKHVTIIECNYTREYLTKHSMHINRRGKGLVAKQLASEIWNLSAAEEMPPISLG
jgi:lysophospholipase L1-like esterase